MKTTANILDFKNTVHSTVDDRTEFWFDSHSSAHGGTHFLMLEEDGVPWWQCGKCGARLRIVSSLPSPEASFPSKPCPSEPR